MAQERTWSPRQLEILEAGNENIEVLAAAGAGKTSVLVEKIFRLVSEPNGTDVDRLLVMTFTRAAAAEMKERLAAKIMDAIEADPGNRRLLRQQTLLYTAQICTIDSFCQSVLKEFYSSVDVDPAYRIGDEAELKLLGSDTVREVVEELYARGDKDFLDYVSCYTTAKDDSKIEENIRRLEECAMSHPDPDGWLEKLYEENGQWNRDELLASREFAAITEYSEGILEGIHAEALRAAEKAELYGLDRYHDTFLADAGVIEGARNAENYEKMLCMLETGFDRLPGKPSATGDYDKFRQEECKELRNAYKKQFDDLRSRFFSMDIDQILESRNMSAVAARTLISATREYMKRFLEKKLDRNVLGFGDVAHFALDVLTDKDENGKLVPSQKAMIYRKRFDRIFVDEYQDSNEIQEELVNAIAGPSGAAPYTFMVGDVKQSIYRFRMAKPELFMNRYELYRSNPAEGKVVVLDSNYRSLEGVLNSTNSVFCRAMRKEIGGITYDEDASLKPGTTAQTETPGPKTRVVIVEGNIDDETAEAVKMIKKIRQERGGYNGIAVLLRKKRLIRSYKRALEDAGIPVMASESTGFLKTFEIETMLDYLRIVDNPARDIPFVGALASPIGGLENEELARIRIEEGMDKLWCEAAGSYAKNGSVPEIREKLARFFEAYNTIRSMNLCRDLGECIERIYDLTGFMTFCRALPNGELRAANLNLLIDYAYAYEETSYSGLFSFVRYIEQLKSTDQDLDESETTEGSDAVTITTIHNSKGLEYPVVLIGGMTKQLDELDTKETVIINSDYGVCPTAIDPDRRIRQTTLMRNIIVNRMTMDMKGEELRLLYVAMTRAREELVMIGSIDDLENSKKPDLWEKAAEKTADASAYDIGYYSGQKTYMDFVMPAALADKENFLIEYIRKESPEPEEGISREINDKTEDSVLDINVDNGEGKIPETDKETEKLSGINAGIGKERDSEKNDNSGTSPEPKKSPDELRKFYREVTCGEETGETREIGARLAYKYPYEEFSKIPTKLSVSDIKKKHYDEVTARIEAKYADNEFEDVLKEKPSGIGSADVSAAEKESEGSGSHTGLISTRAKSDRITGAGYGTLLHKVMRFIPFDLTVEGIEGYLNGLSERGIINVEEKDAIKRSDIEGFIGSPVFARLGNAFAKKTLRREQPFITGIPACEIDRDLYGDSEVLIPVQGVIDCLFEEDGKVFVLDYKTDHRNEEQLRDAYKAQLELYMRAATAACGKPSGGMIIYSFHLGRDFEV